MTPSLRLSVVLLALVALTVGCGEDAPPRETAQPRLSPAPSASPTPSADEDGSEVPPVVAPGGQVDFLSPTGNIRCGLSNQSAVCEVSERTYEPPAKPADCELDHGSMVAVGRKGPAQFLCYGDTGFGVPTPVLPYGRSTTNGLFVCRSSEQGVSCTAAGGAHGFELSRDSYRVF